MKTLHRTLLAAAITGSMIVAGTASAQQVDRSERTTAAQTNSHQPISDTWITTKVKSALLAERDVTGLEISVETANGTVSLSGDVDTQAQIDRATELARGIEGVRTVDTEQLVVDTSRARSAAGSADGDMARDVDHRDDDMTTDHGQREMDPDRSERTVAAQTNSHQPISDTWITTKVKSALLAERDVAGLDIEVETANGTVSLSGDVDTQAQVDRATEVARRIEGVRTVDTGQLVVDRSRTRAAGGRPDRDMARDVDHRDNDMTTDHSQREMDPDRSERTVAANTNSHQPISDSWITTKVKADLLATRDVSGLDIGVETANGIVSLSGDVETEAQMERAEAIARRIDGVQRVDTRQLKVGHSTRPDR